MSCKTRIIWDLADIITNDRHQAWYQKVLQLTMHIIGWDEVAVRGLSTVESASPSHFPLCCYSLLYYIISL